MKRSLAILTIVLLAGCLAGPAAAAPWTLGFKGGLSVAELGGDDVVADATDTRNGVAAGAFAQLELSRYFAMRLEGLYHQKGASAEEFGLDVGLNLDYIEFPLLLVGQLPVGQSATLSAFAGPVMGFNANADAELSVLFIGVSEDIGEYIAPFEFGMAFGLGSAFDAGSAVISLDARYQLGMTSIDDGFADSVLGIPVEVDVNNQGWLFLAGVGFPLGGD